MQPAFGLDKIKFATDPPIFEKVVILYESGKVMRFEEGIDAYSAVVLGTKPYRVLLKHSALDWLIVNVTLVRRIHFANTWWWFPFYEQNNITYFKELFLTQFAFAVENYFG